MIFVQAFDKLDEGMAKYAGGKGKVLARLRRSGFRVPDGFIVFPDAFDGEKLVQTAIPIIRLNADRLRKSGRDISFAIRSSALNEDSEAASFAGEFETVLDVRDDGQLLQAVLEVFKSGKSSRVEAYGNTKGVSSGGFIAVVVQILIKSDISGVIFTADPITGSMNYITGNYVHGMGEALVSGESTPYSFRIRRACRLFKHPTEFGRFEGPGELEHLEGPARLGRFEGPAELGRSAVKLYRTALKIEKIMGVPQDIEWAIRDGRLYILQSRPITTLRGSDPVTGEYNDSLTGDYLWSNCNLTEATPDTMTPLTWSLMKVLNIDAQPFKVPGGHPMVGNICGHPYVNLSVMVSLLHVFGTDTRKILKKWSEVFGYVPEGITVPVLPYKLTQVLATIPDNIRWESKANRLIKELPEFVSKNPERCEAMRKSIGNTASGHKLAALWADTIGPYYLQSCLMLRAVMKKFQEPMFGLSGKLKELVGPEDANILLSNLRGGSSLDSLGPLLGMSRLAKGEITHEAYLRQYGHRGPHEMEISIPSPDEDPGWIDRQLQAFANTSADVEALLAGQHKKYEEALIRLRRKYPRKFESVKKALNKVSEAACLRESLRSEFVRTNRVVRTFALKAGEMTGLGDGVFFLHLEEILGLLSGTNAVISGRITLPTDTCIEKRRETYKRYRSLPALPMLLSGRFDELQWASCTYRRSDIYDSRSTDTKQPFDAIRGFPGAAGIVEGTVRKLEDMEDSYLLQPGEILVTATANIGWTPLFPRAAAIVTDIGAPLSHAAIVARELGIPAVFGCGNATMLLNTGDRIRVNGGNGIVEIIT